MANLHQKQKPLLVQTIEDAHLPLALADKVEKYYPELAGGLSAYPATAAHGPFVHIDARGVRVRW